MMIKQGLKTFKKPALLLSASLGLWLGVSCQDDITTGQSLPLGDEIQFSVASDSALLARSLTSVGMQETKHFLTTIGKDSLFLYATVEENMDQPFKETIDSRAESYTTGGLNSFYLTAYLNDGAQFMNNTLVSKNSQGKWTYSPVKYWPQDVNRKIHFFGYAKGVANGVEYDPQPTFSFDETENKSEYKGTFGTYTLPTPEIDATKTDANNQPDLIFAITPNQSKQGVNDAVHLKFYHALSAILFKMGDMPEGTKIQSVQLKDVKSGGSCTLTVPSENGITFDWDSNGKETYTQDFNVVKTADQMLSEDATTFMMIPQSLADVKLIVNFAIGKKNDYSFEVPLADVHPTDKKQWDANKKYTYRLSTSELVEVDVADQVTNSNVKQEVTIQNTGLTTSYIRAAIIGHWEHNGNIINAWNVNDVGSDIVWGNGWSNYWEMGNDGFYYYQYPVTPGNYTEVPLLESYTLTEDAPISDAVLMVNVIVQAVATDIAATSWTQSPFVSEWSSAQNNSNNE